MVGPERRLGGRVDRVQHPGQALGEAQLRKAHLGLGERLEGPADEPRPFPQVGGEATPSQPCGHRRGRGERHDHRRVRLCAGRTPRAPRSRRHRRSRAPWRDRRPGSLPSPRAGRRRNWRRGGCRPARVCRPPRSPRLEPHSRPAAPARGSPTRTDHGSGGWPGPARRGIDPRSGSGARTHTEAGRPALAGSPRGAARRGARGSSAGMLAHGSTGGRSWRIFPSESGSIIHITSSEGDRGVLT